VDGFGAEFFERLDRFHHRFLAARGDNDRGSGAREGEGDFFSDSVAATGDDGNLVLEFVHLRKLRAKGRRPAPGIDGDSSRTEPGRQTPGGGNAPGSRDFRLYRGAFAPYH